MPEKQPSSQPDFKSKDLYRRLGLDRFAAKGEINGAYRALASQFHPDKNGNSDATTKKRNEENLKLLGEAYAALKKPTDRMKYDKHLTADDIYRRKQREDSYNARKQEEQRVKTEADAKKRAERSQAAQEKAAKEAERVAKEDKADAERRAANEEKVSDHPEPEVGEDSSATGETGPAPETGPENPGDTEAGPTPGPDKAGTETGAEPAGGTGAAPEGTASEEVSKEVPPELKEIYGDDRIPRSVREAFAKTKGKLREDYLRILRERAAEARSAEEAKKQARAAGRAAREAKKGKGRTSSGAGSADTTDTADTASFKQKAEEDRPDSLSDDYADPLERDLQPDTRKGWQDKLRSLIEGAKEKVDWWKSAEEGLIRRSADLDAKAENIGGLEKHFRKMGEKYNKLDWKYKLAIGAGLGLGVTVSTMTGAFPLAYALMAGVGVQRSAALSTMFLKFEKDLMDRKAGGKEKAMAKAMVYTIAMGGAMLAAGAAVRDGLDLVSKTSLGHSVNGWLKDHWPSGQQTTGVSSKGAADTLEQHPQVSKSTLNVPPAPAAAAAVSEAAQQGPVEAASPRIEADALDQASKQSLAEVTEPVATEPAAAVEATPNESLVGEEVPGVSVEATKGKGYEYMLKRLWEKSVEAGLKPEDYPKGSDLRALLEADTASIDKTVHNLATDNEYFKETGRSVQVNLGDKMTIDTKGNIWMNDETILAHKEAPTTAPYHPEATVAPEPPAPVGPESIPYFEQPVENPVTDQPSPASVAPADTGFNPPVTMTDATSYSEKMPTASPEVTPETPAINSHGVPVFTKDPHFYAGAKGEVFISGGTPAEQEIKIREYLKEHPKEGVIGTNITNNPNKIRVRWFVNPDGFVAAESAEPKGWLNFSKLTGAPKPDEFVKIIK